MELKPFRKMLIIIGKRSLNCTVMELKLKTGSEGLDVRGCLNCTVMELKQRKAIKNGFLRKS